MSDRIQMIIQPLPHYHKHSSDEYKLCGIDIDIDSNGTKHHFQFESSDTCIKELLEEIDEYLSGKLPVGTELCYYVPYVLGNVVVYPYSFEIKSEDAWSFRHKRCQNNKTFDFECELSKSDIISLRNQLIDQLPRINWDSLGKTPLYSFHFPDKKFEWCYSAKAFCKELNDLCLSKCIQSIFVSAMNYSDPLRVKENFVNYFIGPELIIKFDDFLLDLLIHASGLFEWRVFKKEDYTQTGPILKFIEDGHHEYCDLGNVYGAFKADYTATIDEIHIEETDYAAWTPKDFDKSKRGKPVELPASVFFRLSNGYTLSLHGWDDDFAIKLQPSEP